MPRQYRDPETGFYISTNDEDWQVGHKPPPPPALEAPAPTWGEIGQGALRSTEKQLAADDARNFQTWLKNKQALTDLLNYENNGFL